MDNGWAAIIGIAVGLHIGLLISIRRVLQQIRDRIK